MIDRQSNGNGPASRLSPDRIAVSRHLDSISDLTVAAPIKRGFIPAFESVTYEGRLRLVMKALFRMRATAREYYPIKPFVDTADRIQALRSFRFAILPGEPSTLLLAVTFDRAWEPYMRLIWRPLGNLLDVIFCNCEKYPPAYCSSFDDYARWVRENQADTDYFYATTGLSVGDLTYLGEVERLQRDGKPDWDERATAFVVPDPEDAASDVRMAAPGQTVAMALEALAALYRLADFYPPDRPRAHGNFLLRATRDLLLGFEPKALKPELRAAYQEEIDWWESLPIEKETPPERLLLQDRSKVQRGILDGFDLNERGEWQRASHGALLMMRIDDPARARGFVGELGVTPGGAEPEDGVFVNLAFTYRGLERIGMPLHERALLPKEFQEGPEERAGLLGDVHEHHPRHWARPNRWQPARPNDSAASPAAAAPVELSEVDLVVQLRVRADHDGHEMEPGHPLYERVRSLAEAAGRQGVALLAVEAMRRASRNLNEAKDHFGFEDGLSQPVPAASRSEKARIQQEKAARPDAVGDDVPLGEILWGYSNSRGDGPHPESPWLDNGSFLVIRKLAQHVKALDDFVAAQEGRLGALTGEALRKELLGKMMGRYPDGTPLVSNVAPGSNLFTFVNDVGGEECPLQSHIRRANPRSGTPDKPVPRIIRRGMSYGPAYDRKNAKSAQAERGLYFMCYNSSIAEQFEVIQRWINGANSTGVASAQNDPLVGIGQPGDARTFRFFQDKQVRRVVLNDEKTGANRFVRLMWSLYLFAPSLDALAMIAAGPANWPGRSRATLPVLEEADRGEQIIARLELLRTQGKLREAALGWKTCLEDFTAREPSLRGDGPAVWAALRRHHGGAIKVHYGDWTGLPQSAVGDGPPRVVLVASRKLVNRVLLDKEGRYSVCGQAQRMKESFGRIYVGLDSNDRDYPLESTIPNRLLGQIEEKSAFDVARGVADKVLSTAFDRLEALLGHRAGKLHLHAKFITPVLAEICRYWFGIPDDRDGSGNVFAGGWDWEEASRRPPRCPGDFIAPSRFFFYPDPLPSVADYGRKQGKRLYKGVADHFSKADGPPEAPLAAALHRAIPDNPDLLVRTLIGIMTGFLPPADGLLRLALFGWIEDGELWRVQQGLASASGDTAHARAQAGLGPALHRAIQKRPAPDMLWRTAVKSHRIGDVEVAEGDRVFLGLVSATMESLEKGSDDVFPVFGGNRSVSPHPTHACPGYAFALGSMLGILSALFDRCQIEMLPAPLMVQITDLQPEPKEAAIFFSVTSDSIAALGKGDQEAGVAGSGPERPTDG